MGLQGAALATVGYKNVRDRQTENREDQQREKVNTGAPPTAALMKFWLERKNIYFQVEEGGQLVVKCQMERGLIDLSFV